MKIVFDSKPVNNEKYLKLKMKSFEGKINTIFHGDKVPEEDSQCIFLSVIFVDFVYRSGKNYYPPVFILKLLSCNPQKNVNRLSKKKRYQNITDDIEISFEEENSDEGNSDEG